ncbi:MULTISPECIES: DUF5801 repeats-in-toxin domain-containing protein [unclassified Sinorhizobium]|uniref:DUF5801 repeats-in-toxin domain-containing protein n=1 Tax=unclassified Sinorhizobium TaxID=2613772 RepID=UPI0024C3DFF5|nr:MULTISPECIES: DUF5801 repeats-in-toxin domain-containing protein [unclassified Sinorhizobium]MDK1373451.1 DUF5801 repeats-in-toxin domain-containing protein [Sinorhizobium sp. 6-70]MDK1482502.1 DUF5801 repeats-in-toxin domain-containing protein [Sinorhizobium sp. 6-117]
MAITITPTGAFAVLDETDGLQNATATPSPAGDADDNDILASSLPTAFSGRLSTLGLTVDEAALSGYNGANTGSNIVNVTGANATSDFSLTGSGGAAFTDYETGATSTSSSGLFAVADDGTVTEVFLFADPTNNNIVYGVAGDSGDDPIAFAIYLEEVKTAGITTGAKMWTVIADGYTLAHGTDGSSVADHDDFVDLTNKLFVAAISENDFSFANAPSGQNLFMMFGNTSQAILITGVDPANESAGQNVSSGSTVSTSQGGGPTTLGTDGQHIKAQKALVVTFVTGANADYIAGPNAGNNPGQPLSPTEANDEANIDFGGYAQDVTGGSITISQMNPGSANTTATVEIQAFLTTDGTGNNYIDNDPLVTGDTGVNIESVSVIRGGVDITNTLDIDIVGNSATIAGVKDDDVIQYTTTDDHNRVLVRNDEPAGSNVSFDLGGFSLRQVASDVEEIGSKVRFEDDGPDAVAKDVAAPTATLDESPLAPNGDGVNSVTITAATIAALFETPDFGEDGEGSVSYTLSGTDGAKTGLWLTGESAAADEILLVKVSDTQWEGRKGGGTGTLAFTVTINGSTGEVTVTRSSATLEHTTDGSTAAAHDDALTMAATANLFAVQHVTDGDGDTDSATAVNPLTLKFEDDGPDVAAKNVAGPTATLDESPLPPNGDGVNSVTILAATIAALFETPDFGADGQGSLSYTLSGTDNAQTGLWLTGESGAANEILLVKVSDTQWEGHKGGAGGTLAFTVSINGTTGEVTVTRSSATLEHTTDSSTAAAHDDALTMAATANLFVVQHITDGDGDTDSATSANPLTLKFEDDGPDAVAKNVAGPTATVDESPLPANGDGVNTATIAAATIANLFEAPDHGADGAGSVTYTLSGTAGARTGLWLTGESAAADEILLVKVSDTQWEGRKGGTGGTLAFTVTIDGSTGEVTLTRSSATLEHTTDGSTAAAHDDALTMASTANLFAVQHVTDGDGDSDTATAVNPLTLKFEDDGPTVTVENSSGTYDAGAQGTWNDNDPGSDGFASLSVNFDGYEIDDDGPVTVDAALTQTGNFTFDGSITDDFNGDGTDETVDFTLTFDPDNDSYAIEVTTPPGSVSTFSTANGSLDAGGPDPVRTLTVNSTDIVFSAVNATTNTNDIKAFLDATEANIEANANYLSSAQMNVSTAGIGLADNLFEGNANAGIDGATTQGGKIDESFVVDPHVDVSSMKVIINDQTNGGYTPASEDLFYRIYFTDGTVGTTTKVVAGDLTAAGKGLVSFTVGDPDGPNNIDAIQLVMGTGTIKVPVIEFTTSETFNPESLHLDFTATLFDGDGDSSSDGFSIDLDPTVV